MKATEANLLKFLKKSPQFVIPIYQRNYSWTITQCRQLWNDLMRAGCNEDVQAHFIGSIVYVERGLGNVVQQEAMLVIDGQQRLTTCSLLILALEEHFESNNLGEILEAFSARKLHNYYLTNPDEVGERHFKLLLSESDKNTLLALIGKHPLPAAASRRITENHTLFRELITANQDKLEAICKGLAKLVIVDVSLDRTQDNPQLIFESMNSTGLELSQADLIRNFILMGLSPNLQTELYQLHWRPMEQDFGQDAYAVHFDAFMRHYLTSKTGDIPNVREVYAAFKTFARNRQGDEKSLVADIHAYASYYCAMALGKENKPLLQQAFHDLRELKVDVAYPFLLDVYHDYCQGLLSDNEMLQIVRLIESYVFRRAICNIPTNSLNKVFAGMGRSVRKDRYLESVQAIFLLLQSYRRFPKDEDFLRDIKVRDLYNFRNRSYWLRRLENHGRKERVAVDEYTIEHILPQNKTLSAEWQAELGHDWQRIQTDWLHTLGNLTLTGYNSQYSDHSFVYKRDQVTDQEGNQIGLRYSPLHLNAGLGQVNAWNEDAIKSRASILAAKAVQVWAMPSLDTNVLDSYRPVPLKPDQAYGLADHPHIANGPMSLLFDALRTAVLALDQCVSEEFFKLTVAYKAETNFVDVIPQANRLRLILNIDFADIEDPRNMCRDISAIGHWGTGNVEVGLSKVKDLPYVMSLIRQSFDQQV